MPQVLLSISKSLRKAATPSSFLGVNLHRNVSEEEANEIFAFNLSLKEARLASAFKYLMCLVLQLPRLDVSRL